MHCSPGRETARIQLAKSMSLRASREHGRAILPTITAKMRPQSEQERSAYDGPETFVEKNPHPSLMRLDLAGFTLVGGGGFEPPTPAV